MMKATGNFNVLSLLWALVLLAAQSTQAQPTNFTVPYKDGTLVIVTLLSADGVVRIRTVPAGSSPSFPHYDLMVDQPPLPAGYGFNVTQTPQSVILSTNFTTIVINNTVPRTKVSRIDGALLSDETQPVSREPQDACGNGRGGPIPNGCLRAYRTLASGEKIFGFGAQFTAVEHSGTTKFIQTDANPNADGYTHISAPFFFSSLGYGVAINTNAVSYFDVGYGTANVNKLHSGDPIMDLIFFLGPSFRDILRQYTQIYGRMDMPPRW